MSQLSRTLVPLVLWGDFMKLTALILAAGKGTRMKSDLPKVLFEAAGKPMIDYVVDVAFDSGADSVCAVIGSGAELVREHLGDRVSFCEQTQQRGTADAVLSAREELSEGKVLILCGDMPLMTSETLRKFIDEAKDHPVAFMSVKVKNPFGYGRVIRNVDGSVARIVEEKDANEDEKRADEVNTGIYLCDIDEMFRRLEGIDCDNAQGEYYLTDIVKDGAYAYLADDEDEFLGVNNRAHLAQASKKIWRDRAEVHMMNGASIFDPENFYADADVVIESDVEIYPNVFLQGKTIVRSGSVIYPSNRIVDSEIGENCEIKDSCLISESYVGEKCKIGPMAQLRPGSELKGENKLGNFVETKKAVFDRKAQASHLTYVGDAEVGKNVNLGCGTITCNYDGFKKYKTIIGDDVFVGSDVQLVAPIKVGKGALIAAGSTITKDVPEGALGITRGKQKNMEGWVEAWKKKQGE